MKGIPVWVSWIKYVSIIYWSWNLLLKIEFSNRSYPCADIITDSPGIQVGVLVEGCQSTKPSRWVCWWRGIGWVCWWKH